MHSKRLFKLFSAMMVLTMLLAACAQPTAAPPQVIKETVVVTRS